MVLKNITIALLIIGGILLIAGSAIKNKIVKNIGIAIFSIIIIFWIGFYIWAFVDMAEETERQFGKETTNNVSKSKELLKSLALPDTIDILRTSVDEIKDVKQLGNNEALVTFEISDIIKAENYPELNDEEHKFDVTLKVDNNTKYNLNFHGQDTYDAETIEKSKGLMLYIRLDANTLNDEYPCISMFDSYSN